MIHTMITHRLLMTLSRIKYGSLRLTTPDHKDYYFTGPLQGQYVHLTLHDWRAIPLYLLKADIGLAESYRDGWWECDNLVSLFTLGLENYSTFSSYIDGNALTHLAYRFMYLFTRNSLKGSNKNIHAHYDIGNSFYRLWLDPSMSYSAAIFQQNDEQLLTAQNRKYDRILNCLEGHSGRLLEIGCGWGGFAARAHHKTDMDYKGITLSKAQQDYAKAALPQELNVKLEDYRHLTGRYDYIVSIEMFEAVGERYWQTYFHKLKQLLSAKGKVVIQTITLRDEHFELYRKSGDMIRTFIFPGGMLPSPTRFNREVEKADFKIGKQFNFGTHYARTMEVWLNNFESNLHAIRALGFDEKFIRLWRFYLEICIALFHHGRTDVMQVELTHA